MQLFKAAVSQVAEQQRGGAIGIRGQGALGVGIHVAGGDEDVRQAVVIQVRHGSAPSHVAGLYRQSRLSCHLVILPLAQACVEAMGVVREVGLQHIQNAVAIEVGHRKAHAGLLHAVGIQGQTALDAFLGKRPVVIVMEEQRRRGITSQVDIRPPVVIKVGCNGRESKGRTRLPDSGFLRNILERPIPAIAIQKLAAGTETARTARRRHTFPVTVWIRAGLGHFADVVVGVGGDEEVQVAVTVVIDEGRAGIPGGVIGGRFGNQSRLRRDVRKRTVAIIAVKRVLAPIGDEKVQAAIVVVIAHGNALAPTGSPQAGLIGNVGEGAIVVVAIEAVGGLRGRIFKTGPAYDEDVQPAIAIVIQQRYAAGGCFRQILNVLLRAIDDGLRKAGLLRDVNQTGWPEFAGGLLAGHRFHVAGGDALGGQHGADSQCAESGAGHYLINPSLINPSDGFINASDSTRWRSRSITAALSRRTSANSTLASAARPSA